MAGGIYLIFGVLFLIERLPGLFLNRYFSFTFCTILDEGITAQGKTVIQESLPLLTQCYSSGIIRYRVRFLRWYEKKFLSLPIIQCYKVIPFFLIQRSKAWNATSSYEFSTFVFLYFRTSAGITWFIALLVWVAKVLHKIAVVFRQILEVQSHTFWWHFIWWK